MTLRQRQCLLGFLGYYAGSPDGIWGRLSTEACRSFQKAQGLQADGRGGPETDKALLDAVAATDPCKTAAFWQEIPFFSREEFRCRCGGRYCSGFPAEPEETLVRLVNDLRRQAGRPAHCSSGLRCAAWNKIQGGVSNSRHLRGKALDFFIEGVSGKTLLAMAQADPRCRYAYIIEGQYVHVDVA